MLPPTLDLFYRSATQRAHRGTQYLSQSTRTLRSMPHGAKAPHEWPADHDAHALLCHLRDDKGKLAKAKGIKGVTGKTTGAQMLVALCHRFLRLDVKRVREEYDENAGKLGSNAYTKSMFELRSVAGRPAKATVPRRRSSAKSGGGGSRQKLPKGERRHTVTPPGNKVVKAREVAMVQVKKSTALSDGRRHIIRR